MKGVSIDYAVSLRARNSNSSIEEYLQKYYGHIQNINSVFGFEDYVPLYGGRRYKREITNEEINQLREMGIYYRIPLSTHNFNKELYEESRHFLEKHHREGNVIITVLDDLMYQIKEEFPLYTFEASVIKNLKDINEINNTCRIYDEVVLHGSWNKNANIAKIKYKEKIRLFSSMGCAFNCPNKICYKSFSDINSRKSSTVRCSRHTEPREYLGTVDLMQNKNVLIGLGFSKFKVLPIDSGIKR